MSVLSFGACCCNVMSQLATLLDLTITSRMVGIIPSAHNPTISATAPSFPSPTRTVTAGCCRKSRSGWPVASTPRRRLLRRRTTWRVHFGAPRPRTASTRSASGRPTRTGQIGTPSTWCASSLAKSCRNKRRGPVNDWQLVETWKALQRPKSRPPRIATVMAEYLWRPVLGLLSGRQRPGTTPRRSLARNSCP
jgi:hypothetical protein